MTTFKDWLFGKFPEYYKRYDTYKDGNQKGVFERFMNALGEELDIEVIPYLENHLDILNPEIVSESLLVNLAETLGNPPDTLRDLSKYRLLLKYIIPLNRIKGTENAYDLLFSFFGTTVTLTVDEIPQYFYDDGNIYDDGFKYDSNCPDCVGYGIAIDDPDDNFPTFGTLGSDPELLENFLQLINYIQPIDMVLSSLSYNGTPISLGD